ncbi:CIII anti-termination [Salmonella phage vB_SosS_Oslo]|nr:CIII anti-termination [Salmonella phage vB_SosS_Oslo]AFM54433.1 putative CIII protein [Salmonella phage vB_SosS_Oslo]
MLFAALYGRLFSHTNNASFEAFLLCKLTKEHAMQYRFAGWPIAGCPSESLLDRITRKLRAGWKRLGEILNQPGVPRHDHYAC